MARSFSEEAEVFGNEKEEELENDNDAEGEDTDAEGELDAEGEIESDGDEESGSDSDEDTEDGDDEGEEEGSAEGLEDAENEEDEEEDEESVSSDIAATQEKSKKSPPPAPRRSLSPTLLRRSLLYPSNPAAPRSYTIEVVCALPHPVATHSLASSLCMTHLLTGSDDGYIRDYDVFAACNSKNFLSQPQRQHCGIQEGAIKAPVSRMWWENPLQPPGQPDDNPVGQSLSPVYSLLVQSDALWGLSGTSTGSVNLFTIRHDPGRVFHALSGHQGPVSALAMLPGEKGFVSAGWDGEALQWDLNTGQIVRNFSHGAQLTAIGMRPLSGPLSPESESHIAISVNSAAQDVKPAAVSNETGRTKSQDSENAGQVVEFDGKKSEVAVTAQPQKPDGDTKSETSYDPLFDEPDAEGEPTDNTPQKQESGFVTAVLSNTPNTSHPPPKASSVQAGLGPPSRKPAIPPLDPVSYGEFSNDVLLAASIDGQVVLWDRRAQAHGGVGRLEMSEKCPPWCLSACWSCDGSQIYAGRRNGTVDLWDVRVLGKTSREVPRLLKTLRNPPSSGLVSCVAAFPDGNHLACASLDNIRLWNVAEAPEGDGNRRTTPAFKIIAGHHGGIISQLLVDAGARFMVTASGNRGWSGDSTRTVLVHDVKGIL